MVLHDAQNISDHRHGNGWLRGGPAASAPWCFFFDTCASSRFSCVISWSICFHALQVSSQKICDTSESKADCGHRR